MKENFQAHEVSDSEHRTLSIGKHRTLSIGKHRVRKHQFYLFWVDDFSFHVINMAENNERTFKFQNISKMKSTAFVLEFASAWGGELKLSLLLIRCPGRTFLGKRRYFSGIAALTPLTPLTYKQNAVNAFIPTKKTPLTPLYRQGTPLTLLYQKKLVSSKN